MTQTVIIRSCLLLASVVFLSSCASVLQERQFTFKNNEWIEWCNIWHEGASSDKLPRVLFVGDSITNQYFPAVAKLLKGKAYGSYMCTSSSICLPAFTEQLTLVLGQFDYEVIHFNNGLHAGPCTDEEYGDYLEATIELLRKESDAVLIWGTITPYSPAHNQYEKNSKWVDARNAIAREIMERHGIPIDDLHTPMKGHAEYYSDGLHYKREAIDLQAEQVADKVLRCLE